MHQANRRTGGNADGARHVRLVETLTRYIDASPERVRKLVTRRRAPRVEECQ